MSVLCRRIKEHLGLRLFSNSSSHPVGLVFLLRIVAPSETPTSKGPLNRRPMQEECVVSPKSYLHIAF